MDDRFVYQFPYPFIGNPLFNKDVIPGTIYMPWFKSPVTLFCLYCFPKYITAPGRQPGSYFTQKQMVTNIISIGSLDPIVKVRSPCQPCVYRVFPVMKLWFFDESASLRYSFSRRQTKRAFCAVLGWVENQAPSSFGGRGFVFP